MEKKYIVHYAEIGLKGRNRPEFERKLMKNLRRQHPVTDVRRLPGRLVVESEAELDLGNVFGVAWWAPAQEVEPDPDVMAGAAVEAVRPYLGKVETFAVRATIADKRFGMRSPDLEAHVGGIVQEAHGLAVNLSKPDLTVHLEVVLPEAFVMTEKKRGPGGLPVGMAGKLVGLFSGGIDSTVAAYLMAKRGAALELLHFYALRDARAAHEAKVGELAAEVARYVPRLMVHYAPYHEFQLATGNLPARLRRQELVVFRRFMARCAERLAELRWAKGIFSGDSLGQVASQTLENLAAVDHAIRGPLFRPLISFDKVEIIDLARRLGFYERAIGPYKDCCSIISRNPATVARIEYIEAIEAEIDIEGLIQSALKEIRSYVFEGGEAREVQSELAVD